VSHLVLRPFLIVLCLSGLVVAAASGSAETAPAAPLATAGSPVPLPAWLAPAPNRSVPELARLPLAAYSDCVDNCRAEKALCLQGCHLCQECYAAYGDCLGNCIGG
jgi:hypothetical protein